ncbi:MAG: hypothetical protein SGJ24_05950 [Chloroflexota bacterium]|nr:hypothetical protein [Chloroflexota bacterium]
MPDASVFHWLDGNGWLVFSGGADDDVRASAFNRAAADGGLAVIALGGGDEAILADLQDLGAPSSYLVDPTADSDAVLLDKLGTASIVVVTGADTMRAARAALAGAPIEGIQIAYDQGAIVLIEGAAIGIFGGWSVEETLRDGLDWLEGVALMVQGSDDSVARELLLTTPNAIVVAVEPGSAIAFAADGVVETWGEREVVVRLGSGFASD